MIVIELVFITAMGTVFYLLAENALPLTGYNFYLVPLWVWAWVIIAGWFSMRRASRQRDYRRRGK